MRLGRDRRRLSRLNLRLYWPGSWQGRLNLRLYWPGSWRGRLNPGGRGLQRGCRNGLRCRGLSPGFSSRELDRYEDIIKYVVIFFHSLGRCQTSDPEKSLVVLIIHYDDVHPDLGLVLRGLNIEIVRVRDITLELSLVDNPDFLFVLCPCSLL